jgi:mitochondrial fission protein ELM1
VPKKIKKKNKNSIKTKKDILINFESNNNYLIYLSQEDKIISTKDCSIKEDLIYSDNYNLEENDYISL